MFETMESFIFYCLGEQRDPIAGFDVSPGSALLFIKSLLSMDAKKDKGGGLYPFCNTALFQSTRFQLIENHLTAGLLRTFANVCSCNLITKRNLKPLILTFHKSGESIFK